MQLWPHQQEALARLGQRAIYGDAAGSGKTATAVRWADTVHADRVLVLASSDDILDQWVDTFNDWSRFTVFAGYGTKPQRERARQNVDRSRQVALVLNYEALRLDIDALLKIGFDALIFDEAHHLKGRRNAVYFGAEKLAKRADCLLHVTGTPVLNHAAEAWSMLHLLDPRTYSSFWKWAGAHFEIEVTDFHGKAPQPIRLVKGLRDGHADIVREQLAPYLVQRSFDELFPDAPPVELTEVVVELGDAERRVYDELVRRSWSQVGDELVLTENAVAKTTRLRQLTSSWATFAAEDEWPGAKIDATVKIDRGLVRDEQVLILSAYRATAERVAREVDGAEFIHGDTKRRERKDKLSAFKDGRLRALSATIGVLGEGVDGLQVARNLIQLDRDWTPARNEQILARLRRGGQKRSVRGWYLLGNRTIDEAVSDALEGKIAIVDSIL
ncbi:MAG TPA: SNF2-related protein [Verrucomicrobiae bacterium]|nr:SNF2-related protein [Verrucomicrobiae bacterium]